VSDLRILMVTDGWLSPTSGSFGPAVFDGRFYPFSLYWVLDTLRQADPPHHVTTAHRAKEMPDLPEPGTADLQDFSFSRPRGESQDLPISQAVDLLAVDYDEIWLFAVEPKYPAYALERAEMRPGDDDYERFHLDASQADDPSPYLLSDAEVEILYYFGSSGRGLFATGDHEDLGYAMCGRLARIRGMRNWWYPHGVKFATPLPPPDEQLPALSPDGEPVAPSGSNFQRHDTLVRPPDATAGSTEWPFQWQSDRTPQRISVRRRRLADPHPLLSGVDGPIDVLPDHPHEGRCVVPPSLAGDFAPARGAATIGPEWPASPSGFRPAPEIVATAHVTAGHTTTPPIPPFGFLEGRVKPSAIEQDFGVIGAYDGHLAHVGRIVVDATWHHFFLVNVNALALENGVNWSKIQNYYRNIAGWLAPRSSGSAMVIAMIRSVLEDPEFAENFNFGRLPDAADAGPMAFGAAAARYGTGAVLDAVSRAVRDRLALEAPHPWFEIDEADQRFGPIPPDPRPWNELAVVVTALGGAVRAALWERAKRASNPDARSPEEFEATFRAAVLEGLDDGARSFARDVRDSTEAFARIAGAIDDDLSDGKNR
jgi:hypothetical protein